MAPFTLSIPADQVEAIHEALLTLRGVKVDALDPGWSESQPAEKLQADRDKLAEIDAALGQVRWDDRRTDEPARIAAEPTLIEEVVFSALDLAAHNLLEEFGVRQPSMVDVDRAAMRADMVVALLAMLRDVAPRRV